MIEKLKEMGLSPSSYEECLKLVIDKKNGLVDIDWQEIVDRYNLPITSDTLRKASATIFGGAFVNDYLKAKNNNALDKTNLYTTIETSINKDGTYSSKRVIEMSEEQSKDSNYVLKAHGFNPSEWKIVSLRNNIRQVVSKQDGVVNLYASFLTVKPVDEKELSLEKIGEFFDKLDRNYSIPEIETTNDYLYGNKMLLIDIADLHLNLQASMFTTGNEYNCDIAEKLFFDVIEDILSRTSDYDFEEITFIVGGDMMNEDSLSGTTTKGTPQVRDLHYYDACERLYAMIIKAIDFLKQVSGKVNVIYVMGNHDEVTGYKLAKYIDAWFRNDDMVNVDFKPLARKYYLYGKTLLCFAHDGKVNNLPALIADEAREYWSKANSVEVFLQHLHSEQVLVENNNIRIQRLPTISAKSKWTNDNGYNSKRQCKTFIFDKEDGLTDVLYTKIK